jgi:hypothetical protein
MDAKQYDIAQTRALKERDRRIDSMLFSISQIRKEPGSLDIVADLLDLLQWDLTAAQRINNDLQMNRIEQYLIKALMIAALKNTTKGSAMQWANCRIVRQGRK